MDIQEFARKSTKPCTDKTKKRNEMAWPYGWKKPTTGGPIHPGFRPNTQGPGCPMTEKVI